MYVFNFIVKLYEYYAEQHRSIQQECTFLSEEVNFDKAFFLKVRGDAEECRQEVRLV
jgi:hypothetical protein